MFRSLSSNPSDLFACAVLLAGAMGFTPTVWAQTLNIGALPAADAIVLYVAADEKLFEKAGLDVKVVPFKSALEVGAAMRAGRLEGHFGDLMNVFTQNETGAPQAVILTTTHTNTEQRAFGLTVSPKFATGADAVDSLEKLKSKRGVETAMSSSTIIDYLATRMKDEMKIEEGVLKNVEVKPIPIRLQMVLSGKTPTALLPEPLVSVVEAQGGKVIWDDRKLNESLAVVALKKAVADETTVKAFRAAVADAAKLIEAEPEKYRAVMVKRGLLPANVADGYKMVRFSIYGTEDGLPPLPTVEEVKRVGGWMLERKMIKAVPAFEDVVIP